VSKNPKPKNKIEQEVLLNQKKCKNKATPLNGKEIWKEIEMEITTATNKDQIYFFLNLIRAAQKTILLLKIAHHSGQNISAKQKG